MRLTGKDLWDDYQKLPENEKIKFDRIRTRSSESIKKELLERKSKMMDDLTNIQSSDGSPYFNVEFIKKYFLKKDVR